MIRWSWAWKRNAGLEDVYGVKKGKGESVVPLGLTDTFTQGGTNFADGGPSDLHRHDWAVEEFSGTRADGRRSARADPVRRQIATVSTRFSWQEFEKLVDAWKIRQKCHHQVTSEANLADLLRKARGYVLMSRYENWSLAAHEAAACGLPMLLPDQRWARERFGDQGQLLSALSGGAPQALRTFYEACPNLPSPRVPRFTVG